MFNETRMPLGLILATALGTPVLAQVPPATAGVTAEGSGGGIGEIIVTAQRREQALQKVPVAVSTVNAAQIAARRLNNIDQITGIAPNLVITTGNGSSSSTQIAVRGSVTTNNTINYDPAVGLYLDGVYVGKAAGSVFDIGDLERVEVLRGPQGTLFGRNTLAGAISFVTRKPEDKLRIEGELTYGNYNAMAGRGVLNLPLADTLFIKVSGQFQKRDGFTKLVPDPFALPAALARSATGRLDDRDRYSVMGQVRWQPTDALTLDYSYDLSHTNEHPFTGLFGIGSGNIFDPNSPIYSGLPLYLYVIPGDNRPKTTSSDIRTRDRSRVYGHSLTASYDLGFATAKSITAYRNVTTHQGPLGQDLDGSPMAIATGGYVNHYSQFSQELQLTGAVWDDRISYVVGGYYYRDNGQADGPQSYFLGATNVETKLGLRSRAYAAYGQVDFKATEKLTITGGVRWTSERKRVNRLYQVVDSGGFHFDPPLTVVDITPDGQCYQPSGLYAPCSSPNQRTFSNVSPTGIIAYQFTSDLNVYAKYAAGFRSGSFNADAGPSADTANPASDILRYYRPEKNQSVELGIKSRFFDRRLTINVAAFYNTEVDKQVASFVGVQSASTINNNAGKGRVKGLEVEVDARPIDSLRVYGTLGLLRARFSRFLDTITAGPDAGTQADVANNRYYPKSPRTTLSGGADLEVFKGERGTITLSGDAQYQSKTFALPGAYTYDPRFPLVATAASYAIPLSSLFNARIRWDDVPLGASGLKGYAMLWGKNLGNNRKVNNKIEFGPNFGGLLNANYLDPRTYGVTMGFKY